MKFPSIIATAILFLSGTALAYDMTYMSSLKANQTKQVTVELPSGKSTVEVWATDNEKISCQFIDRGTGNVAYESSDTQRCVGRADLSLPAHMLAKITNNGNKDLDFRIWVHDTTNQK
jgi:hypothetical protein